MNLLRTQIGGCDVANVVAITCLSIGKRPNSRVLATLGSIFLADKLLEALVSRNNLFVDRIDCGGTQPLLVCRGNGCREVFDWLCERTVFAVFRSDLLDLYRHFVQ